MRDFLFQIIHFQVLKSILRLFGKGICTVIYIFNNFMVTSGSSEIKSGGLEIEEHFFPYNNPN